MSRDLWHCKNKTTTEFDSNNVKKINQALKEAWTEMKKYCQEAHIQRERHHEDMLRRSHIEDNGQKEKVIRAIQHAERQARQQMRINRVSGKPKQGVRMVYVPDKNKPGSWTMLAERKEVEQAIIEQN